MLFVGFFCVLFVVIVDEVVVSDYFCMNEVFFEIGMDDVGSLGCGCVNFDCLGVDFLYFCCEIGL